MALLDEISPSYYGEDRLTLTLTDPDQLLRVFEPVLVSVDYSGADPQGVMLPLEMTVTGPDGALVVRQSLTRFAPSSLAFTPVAVGSHLVRLAECFHNKWFGALVLDITGDSDS